ncbi:MAG: ADP-ribosylation factor-like protein [Candidatus Hodarchaeales archaeon]|jgi:GTPase SAR1 family protein
MSEWVSDSEITERLGYKILIAGLSEAGKTAVKRIFFLKQQTEDVDSLSATINYERMSLTIHDTPITIVDLGGQKIFLKRFLSGFSPFVFSSVKTLIFLIDVANKTSRNNAIQYFKACLEKLSIFSPEAEVFVFLHKNDLVRDSPNYESIHEQLKEQFQLERPHRLRFFRTTIYKPETVIDSFGRIFELTVPKLSKSEFVDFRTIGEIEEYHREDMTIREPRFEPEIGGQKPAPIAPKIAGDQVVLSKLQGLMQQAVRTGGPAANNTKGQISTKSIFLGSAATEESATTETILTPVKAVKQVHTSPLVETQPYSTPVDEEPISSVSSEITSEAQNERILKQETVDINPQISHLVDFFRIGSNEATEIVNTGYADVFEMAVTSGIPIPLVTDVLLKYLPFIRKSQKEKKYRMINREKLLELFQVYLKGLLQETDIVKCLVLMTEKPKMNINKILKKYLTPKKKKKKKEKKEKKIPEHTRFDIPVEAESVEGIITIPDARGMGFKVEVIEPEGINARITFHLQGLGGQRELIGNTIVSVKITREEILYLLAYEMNMTGLGIFEDGIGSMNFGARIIHEAIKQIREKDLGSTTEVKTKTVRKMGGYLAETVNFIIPMEIESEGTHILIPDSENVTFTVEQVSRGILLSFIQRGYPIGQANVVDSITVLQIRKLLKEAMQIPVESDGAIDFASRIIHAAIKNLTDPSISTKIQPKSVLKPFEKQEDETSEKLKSYLELLEDD